MTLALTAYPSSANGTSSGKSSTSPGNIFLSAYSDTNRYQRWKFIDENGIYADTELPRIANGTYYLNHAKHGKYLRKNGLALNAVSGYVNQLGDAIQWKITGLGDNNYVIQPANDLSKYLMVSSPSATAPVLGSLSSADTVPDNCKWYYSSNTLKNAASSKYLYVYKSSSSQYTVGLTASRSEDARWYIKSVGTLTNELQSLSVSAMSIEKGESRQLTINKNPVNAQWSGNGDFIYTASNSRISVSETGLITANSEGTAAVTVMHKTTGVSATLNVTVTPRRPIEDGTYFIQNRRYEKYIQPDNDDAPNYSVDGGIMEQMGFVGDEYQKWTLTYLDSGYYKITSNISGYAITIPSGKETEADVNLILTTYTGADNQKWKITKTANGSYKIKAKSSEGYTAKDLVLDVQSYIVTQNLNI